MKHLYFLFPGIVFALIFVNFISLESSKSSKKFTIVIHGGAGTVSKDIPDSVKLSYLNTLSDVLSLGKKFWEKEEQV